jgi:hypothetical protein
VGLAAAAAALVVVAGVAAAGRSRSDHVHGVRLGPEIMHIVDHGALIGR